MLLDMIAPTKDINIYIYKYRVIQEESAIL
jgi:hypothetical protein